MDIFFQDINGIQLLPSNQLCKNFEGTYSPHDEGRFINVLNNADYYYLNINDRESIRKTSKKLPLLYSKRTECCGCTACFSVCSRSGQNDNAKFDRKQSINGHRLTGAITMLPDEEGFLYPVIDAEICIRCYKCIQVCPLKK